MKKLILTIATLSLISFGAQAFAGDYNKQGKKHNRLGKILNDAELSLTEEQLASIKDIRANYKAKHDALKPEGDKVKISDLDKDAADYQEQVDAIKAEKAERRELMKADRENIYSEIKALLTSEQQYRFDELIAEMQAKKGKKNKSKDGI